MRSLSYAEAFRFQMGRESLPIRRMARCATLVLRLVIGGLGLREKRQSELEAARDDLGIARLITFFVSYSASFEIAHPTAKLAL